MEEDTEPVAQLGWRPYGEKIIVERIEDEDKDKIAGGLLYRPDVTIDESRRARILAVGLSVKHPEALVVGAECIIAKLAGEPWTAPDGRNLLILHEADINLVAT